MLKVILRKLIRVKRTISIVNYFSELISGIFIRRKTSFEHHSIVHTWN